MHALRLLVGGLMVSALSVGVRADDKIADADKLLPGVWQATKADEQAGLNVGAVVVFGKDGKMKVTADKDGKDITVEGTYKVKGDKLDITLKLKEEKQFTVTIRKLSADMLVTANDAGHVIEFKRKK
jgi:uncharacterized protein (TIGR03066 family)